VKKINGKDKFFLYFANGGGGIGVLTADSPSHTTPDIPGVFGVTSGFPIGSVHGPVGLSAVRTPKWRPGDCQMGRSIMGPVSRGEKDQW
jgi:hypothetical protein